MLSIFKKKYPSEPVDFSSLVTDMHSHLAPGIDDGSPNIETSLQLIKGLEDLGYKQFITTPHVMSDTYKNTPTTISNALNSLKEALSASGMNTKIKAAAEYYLDDYFSSLLENAEPLLTIEKQLVLAEFSFMYLPLNLKEQLFNLQIKGYQVILAHPERYQYFASDKKIYNEFKDMGCLLQVNLLSFTGYYGKTVQELAQYLLHKNYIDFVGTDLHNQRHLDALRNGNEIMPAIKQLLHAGKLKNPSLEVTD